MEKHRKTFIGRVVSNKMQKTVVVVVKSRRPHPKYKRVVTHTAKFKVHDEENACSMGDVVRIEETRPLSREKRWRVVEIVSRGRVPEVKPQEIAAPSLEPSSPPPVAEAAPQAAEVKDDPDLHSTESSG